MFTLNNFHTDVREKVPSNWIFEHYLDIEPLTGQSVRLKSVFNLNDETPSMFLYYDRNSNSYKFKCFSSGESGDAISLMHILWKNVNFSDTAQKILKDYDDYCKTGAVVTKKSFNHVKWEITAYETRGWIQADADFWLSYNISSDLLNYYNVKPLKFYRLNKVVNDLVTKESFAVSKGLIYGYFKKDGTLYKIYQPEQSTRKFLKVCSYTQGLEQLENNKHLVITSSLKDIMALRSLNLRIDIIAPDSENTKLPSFFIEDLKTKYETVVTYMDSDSPGIQSMSYYYNNYSLPFCYIPKEKDFSDIIKHHGVKEALSILIPCLNKSIEKYKSLHEIV